MTEKWNRAIQPLPTRDSGVSYGELLLGMEINGAYFDHPDAVRDTMEYNRFIGHSILARVPEAIAVFSDGFPNYVARLAHPPVPIPEIGRFQKEQLNFYSGKVVPSSWDPGVPITLSELREVAPTAGTQDAYGAEKEGNSSPLKDTDNGRAKAVKEWARDNTVQLSGDIWPCPTCIETNKLPNLRDQCRGCNLTSIKPRDVMRMWHDIDLQVVVNGEPGEVAPRIRQTLHDEGLPCNDEKLGHVVEQSGITFPIDLTVIPATTWKSELDRIVDTANFLDVRTPAIKMWLHDEPVQWPLGLNFAFSMEPLVARSDNRGVVDAYTQALSRFRRTHDISNVMTTLQGLPRIHGRLLQAPEVAEGIQTRLIQGGAPFVEFV